MIKVKNNSQLSVYAAEHHNHVYTHMQKRTVNKQVIKDVDSFFKKTKCCSKKTFKDLICGDVKFLRHLISKHNTGLKRATGNRLKNLYLNVFSLRSKELGQKGNKYNSSSLVDKLELRVCPFCNRNYIFNIKLKNEPQYKLSQTDHFFPKDARPYLAMSFFNLVPSCLQCNFVKNNSDVKGHPFELLNSHSVKFKLDYSLGDVTDSLIKCSPDDLVIRVTRSLSSNARVFYLKQLYKNHIDYVNDLLMNIEFYDEGYFEEIKLILKDDVNLSVSDMNRILFGNYTSEEDFNKRPLSKLTHDILKQFSIDV